MVVYSPVVALHNAVSAMLVEVRTAYTAPTLTKIVIIGAGSASFGPTIIGDLAVHAAQIGAADVWLVDINAEASEPMARFAARMFESAAAPYAIHPTTDRCEALPDADFVIVSIAVDRLETWKLDWQIPLRHGVRHVLGENGGPGGLSHALRNIPLLLGIAKDVERLAPRALVLNFTNPLSRLCLALHRHSSVRFAGLCHQLGEGYRLVNQVLCLVDVLEARAGIDVAEADALHVRNQRAIEDRLHLVAAGLNHFSFILALRDRETGADLVPLFRERLAAMPASFEPMSRRLYDTFGLFCATGDGHAGEYVGFAADTAALSGYDYDARAAYSDARWRWVRAVADGRAPALARASVERAVPIMCAVVRNLNQPELSVNIANRGCIENLPHDAIVEVPGIVDARGVHGAHVGALPRGLAAMMRNQIEIQELVVEAAVNGDRKAAMQALLLDPTVRSYMQAGHMLDDLLTAHAKYLPQFFCK